MKHLVLGLAGLATLAVAMPAFAQPVEHREVRQQERILQGARSGALTPGETRRLEAREDRLRQREAVMRARDAGHLTHRDRRVLARMENRDSRAIERLKHNRRFD
jgi:hypothetical protein